MQDSFACPDCGCEIRLEGLAPGRQVRCGWCESLVEVPYFPRVVPGRGKARRRRVGARAWRSVPPWARLAVVVLVPLVGLALVGRVVGMRWRSAEDVELARMVEESVASEKAGRLDNALVVMEAVLARAGRRATVPPALDAMRRRRDDLSLREARALLAGLNPGAPSAAAEPGRAVGQVLTLQARAARDPALDGLGPEIDEALHRLRLAWAEADAAEAEQALADGRPDRAMELCERQYRTAAELSAAPRRRFQDRAAELARQVILRHGTIVETARGQFTLGSPETYRTAVLPVVLDRLRSRKYLARPARPLWPELWDACAPFRMGLDVVERQEGTYLASPNRLSRIEGHFLLLRGGTVVWSGDASAATQVPLPGLSSYQASRVAATDHRSPDFERLLYDNARAGLIERVGNAVRNLPECPGTPVSPARTTSTTG